MHGQNIARPQFRFQDAVDNRNTVFVPKITTKYNSLVPLDDVYLNRTIPLALYGHGALSFAEVAPLRSYPHPYRYEIVHAPLPSDYLITCKEQLYGTLDETPCTWISTEDQLDTLCE